MTGRESKNRATLHGEGPIRILVTGSRGKSGLVRMIHAALEASGLEAHARITGVLPRHLKPGGCRVIMRGAGAHVAEMHWWLRGLPTETMAVVMENSAVAPDLQPLAGRWLKPHLVVVTNVRPDHQEIWGPTTSHAATALAAGVPRRSLVILPSEAASESVFAWELERKGCRLVLSDELEDPTKPVHIRTNLALALTICRELGLDRGACLEAMEALPPDLADFRLLDLNGARLAVGFAINDPASTTEAFAGLGWPVAETTVVYNHRRDRYGRYEAFMPFLGLPWREVLIIGDRPVRKIAGSRFLELEGMDDFHRIFHSGGLFLGCGNLAGPPLAFLLGEHPPDSPLKILLKRLIPWRRFESRTITRAPARKV